MIAGGDIGIVGGNATVTLLPAAVQVAGGAGGGILETVVIGKRIGGEGEAGSVQRHRACQRSIPSAVGHQVEVVGGIRYQAVNNNLGCIYIHPVNRRVFSVIPVKSRGAISYQPFRAVGVVPCELHCVGQQADELKGVGTVTVGQIHTRDVNLISTIGNATIRVEHNGDGLAPGHIGTEMLGGRHTIVVKNHGA